MKSGSRGRQPVLAVLASLVMSIGAAGSAFAQNRAFSFAYDQPPSTA